MGTPLREAINEIGGGVEDGREIVAVLSGVAERVHPGDRARHAADLRGDARRRAAGSARPGFIVIDDRDDVVAVAHGRRALPRRRVVRPVHAVQARRPRDGRPARQDPPFRRVRTSTSTRSRDRRQHRRRQRAVHARATSSRIVVEQLARAVPRRRSAATSTSTCPPADPYLVAPILEIEDGRARARRRPRPPKQPDWTYDETDSGKWPAQRIDERRAESHED